MSKLTFTWLGHATFVMTAPNGKRIVFDPFLKDNPSCPPEFKQGIREADLIFVTHGHEDHTGDVVSVARATRARVVAPYELALYFQEKGLQDVTGMNPGGTISSPGLHATMVPAVHSSSVGDGGSGARRYLGLATGYVVRFDGGPTIYYSGDTSLFGDMRLIGEMYQPQIAFLPIGDFYTMGPEQAAKASELLGVRQIVPMHYGTFPALTGTPARLRELVTPRGVEVLELKPGETAK